jgi:cytoplasmic iron level regulating protein YaaA (DUF328/UPF0246 family)
MGGVLIVISCSRDKATGPGRPYEAETFIEALPESMRRKILEMRASVRKLIKSGNVDDLYQREGNRKNRASNQSLAAGPDFGGREQLPVYLKARERYQGRLFSLMVDDDWSKLKELGYNFLILSGMYGWLLADEMIQNYDCHLSDRVKIEDRVMSLGSIWGALLTEALVSYVDMKKIDYVIDLLSEESYQNAIGWSRLNKISVLHRVFKKSSGPNILPYLALFFKNEILSLKAEDLPARIPPGLFIEKDYFEGDQVVFESSIDEIGEGVAREDKRKSDSTLMERIGKDLWTILTPIDKDNFRVAEHFYQELLLDKKEMASPMIHKYWEILETSREAMLRALIARFKKTFPAIASLEIRRNQLIDLNPAGELNQLVADINAGSTQRIFENSLRTNRAGDNMAELLRRSFGESRIRLFVSYYGSLRTTRNEYKRSVTKPLISVKQDLNDFRRKLFAGKDSPLTLFSEGRSIFER